MCKIWSHELHGQRYQISYHNDLKYSPAGRCDAILVADLPQWTITDSSIMLLALQHIPDHKMVCPQQIPPYSFSGPKRRSRRMKPVVSKDLVGAYVGLCWFEYHVIEGRTSHVEIFTCCFSSFLVLVSFFFCFGFINLLRLVRAYS